MNLEEIITLAIKEADRLQIWAVAAQLDGALVALRGSGLDLPNSEYSSAINKNLH